MLQGVFITFKFERYFFFFTYYEMLLKVFHFLKLKASCKEKQRIRFTLLISFYTFLPFATKKGERKKNEGIFIYRIELRGFLRSKNGKFQYEIF